MLPCDGLPWPRRQPGSTRSWLVGWRLLARKLAGDDAGLGPTEPPEGFVYSRRLALIRAIYDGDDESIQRIADEVAEGSRSSLVEQDRIARILVRAWSGQR